MRAPTRNINRPLQYKIGQLVFARCLTIKDLYFELLRQNSKPACFDIVCVGGLQLLVLNILQVAQSSAITNFSTLLCGNCSAGEWSHMVLSFWFLR